ncbi:hypothetical protein GE061_015850 [Apolygus lucorum]|uniref:Uncharacterized protein n=1 Tax=Apolygus lucorum TaxID=248454 RepID=A0A6A4JGK1_APOLU|nr:hypothetical protein GE061_015850 [Apolygus lucorum]
MPHNERVCHEAGERRQNYLNQIKCILEKMDDTPCTRDYGGTNGAGQGGAGGQAGEGGFEKPLIEYPGYINRLNPKFNKPFWEPLIPNVMAERRLYCDEQGRDLTARTQLPDICREILSPEELCDGTGGHHPAPKHAMRSKPAELKNGYMIQGCGCRKHNGLQDKCERTECHGRPACLTQPEPTCGPASTYMPPQQQMTREEIIEEALANWPRPKLQYCCCTPDCGARIPKSDSPNQGAAKFACYPCSN